MTIYKGLTQRKRLEAKERAQRVKGKEWEGRKLNLVHFIKKLKFFLSVLHRRMLLIKPCPKPPVFNTTEMKIIIITLNIWKDYHLDYVSWNMEVNSSLLPTAMSVMRMQALPLAAPSAPTDTGEKGPLHREVRTQIDFPTIFGVGTSKTQSSICDHFLHIH